MVSRSLFRIMVLYHSLLTSSSPRRVIARMLKWTPKIGQVAKLRIASTINRNTEVINHVKETQNTSPGV
jgi:hypothetical protein